MLTSGGTSTNLDDVVFIPLRNMIKGVIPSTLAAGSYAITYVSNFLGTSIMT